MQHLWMLLVNATSAMKMQNQGWKHSGGMATGKTEEQAASKRYRCPLD
jgi:hypothetical protein